MNGILSKPDIKRAFTDGGWKIYNRAGIEISIDDERMVVGPNSIDVRLSSTFMPIIATGEDGVIDPEDPSTYAFNEFESDVLNLAPGAFILGISEERFVTNSSFTGANVDGLVDLQEAYYKQDLSGRSSWARLGIMVHAVAGYGDYGFQGHWVFEIKNIGYSAVKLRSGRRIAQVDLKPCTGKPPLYQGGYNGQIDRLVPPQIGSKERF